MKIKNAGLTILIILCMALAVTSCAIKEMILGPPEPSVLEEQNNQYNPKCLVCHTVGYMASDGYINQELTPELLNVSCESCHGRGDHHMKFESGQEVTIHQIDMKLTSCVT